MVKSTEMTAPILTGFRTTGKGTQQGAQTGLRLPVLRSENPSLLERRTRFSAFSPFSAITISAVRRACPSCDFPSSQTVSDKADELRTGLRWLAGAHRRIPVGLILADEAASQPYKPLALRGRRIGGRWHESSYLDKCTNETPGHLDGVSIAAGQERSIWMVE